MLICFITLKIFHVGFMGSRNVMWSFCHEILLSHFLEFCLVVHYETLSYMTIDPVFTFLSIPAIEWCSGIANSNIIKVFQVYLDCSFILFPNRIYIHQFHLMLIFYRFTDIKFEFVVWVFCSLAYIIAIFEDPSVIWKHFVFVFFKCPVAT